MTLSIIIPVYNVAPYLGQCLDSVLVDNGFTGQIICVNDGSTDGSLMILNKYSNNYPNIEVISHKNQGLSEARNAGLRTANGDYVMFVDSDDWLFPNSLQHLLDNIDGEDVVYFNAKKYYDKTGELDDDCPISTLVHLSGIEYFNAVYNTPRNMPQVCVCGGAYKRQFLLKNNLWNQPGIYHEDELFTPKVLLAAEDVSQIDMYIYAYRIRQGSITAKITPKHIADSLFVCRQLYCAYSEVKGKDITLFREHLAELMRVNIIEGAYSNGISLNLLWRFSDSFQMYRSAQSSGLKRIAKLTFLSPCLAYKYHMNQLRPVLRRMINRFM